MKLMTGINLYKIVDIKGKYDISILYGKDGQQYKVFSVDGILNDNGRKVKSRHCHPVWYMEISEGIFYPCGDHESRTAFENAFNQYPNLVGKVVNLGEISRNIEQHNQKILDEIAQREQDKKDRKERERINRITRYLDVIPAVKAKVRNNEAITSIQMDRLIDYYNISVDSVVKNCLYKRDILINANSIQASGRGIVAEKKLFAAYDQIKQAILNEGVKS